MTIATTAISFILLASGLATCGWRFFEAFREGTNKNGESSIGRLLMSLFFLSAGYNAVLGIGSLLLTHNPTAMLWAMVTAHILLTALAILSVYTVYYIFCPETPPRALLSTVSVMGGVGLFHINTPLQLAPLLTGNLNPSLLVITASLLTVSLGALLFLFIQLFRRAQTRSIKILSAAVCGLTIASTVNMAIQLATPYWHFSGTAIGLVEIALGLVGAGFLVSMITGTALRGATTVLLVLVGSWIAINFGFKTSDAADSAQQIWSFAVQAIAVWGVWWGFKFAKQHNFFKQPLGQAVTFLTLGLLAQTLAHNTYFAYLFVSENGVVPYPGLPDIGYLLGIALYIVAALLLGRALGIDYNLRTLRGKIFATALFIFLITAGLWATLAPSYFSEEPGTMKIIVDLAYTLLETTYLTLIVIVYRAYRSGKINTAQQGVLTLLFAFAAQFAADTVFTYATERGWWTDGSYGDLAYLAAYFLMAVALIKLGKKSAEREAIPEKEAIQLPTTATARPTTMYGVHGAIALFTIFLGWWVVFYISSGGDISRIAESQWGNFYCLMAVWGVWFGFKALQRWGGTKERIGKSILLFVLGLLFQIFGQIIFGIYINFFGIEVPYPSFADIAYFGSVILYILAAIQLGKGFGISYDFKKIQGKAWLITIFISLSILGVLALGGDYAIDQQHLGQTILDFAYPLGEALFVTLVILLLRTHAGNQNILRIKIGLPILYALVAQYAADSVFAYQASQGLWRDGVASELIYLSAYFLMTSALIRLGNIGRDVTVPMPTGMNDGARLGMDLSQGYPKIQNPWSISTATLIEIRQEGMASVSGKPIAIQVRVETFLRKNTTDTVRTNNHPRE